MDIRRAGIIYEQLEPWNIHSLSDELPRKEYASEAEILTNLRIHFGQAITKTSYIWPSKLSSALDCVFPKANSSRISTSLHDFDSDYYIWPTRR